jgi:A/G-specific adenine glycosylase
MQLERDAAMREFPCRVVDWQRRSGRHDLPWQNTRDPYRVWLSEIMLQQTQVTAVIPYFGRFVERFPSIAHLARAHEDAVLAAWSGLGYYARARNLHRAAQRIEKTHAGHFPDRFEAILALPGVGRSTAGAIAVFAFGQRFPILDGNVKRVLARCFGVEGYPGDKAVSDRLWQLTEVLLPRRQVAAYTQGLMDLGAQVCKRSRPACSACPLVDQCVARRDGREGELPSPRPKKARPQRSTVMLILRHGDDILLEKRPAPGIWGGLWSFPESDAVECAAGISRRHYGVELQDARELAPIEHGFTHFSLRIVPLLCSVARRRERLEAPGRVWLSIEDAAAHAIPVPVRTLLEQLQRVRRTPGN